MKKQRIITAAILIILLSACSKDFQSSNWGDSIEKVKLSEEEQEWYHSNSPDGTQTAIYQGDLLVKTKWENKRSKVLHAIFGTNGEGSHEVEYQGIPSTE